MIQSLPEILKSLNRIQTPPQQHTQVVSEADSLLSKLSTFEFVFMFVLNFCFVLERFVEEDIHPVELPTNGITGCQHSGSDQRVAHRGGRMENIARYMARENDVATVFAEQRVCKRQRHFEKDAEDDQIEDRRRRFKADSIFTLSMFLWGCL